MSNALPQARYGYNGNRKIIDNADTWLEVPLPTGTVGKVVFKDNRDGTASLAGYLVMLSNQVSLSAPKGYQFIGSVTLINPYYKSGTGYKQSVASIVDGVIKLPFISNINYASQVNVVLFANNTSQNSDVNFLDFTGNSNSVKVSIKKI